MDKLDGKPGWKSHGVEPLSIFWWATFVGAQRFEIQKMESYI
jgi:hypothetical protein